MISLETMTMITTTRTLTNLTSYSFSQDGLSEYEALNTKEDGEKKEQEKVEGHLSYGLTVLTATVFMVGEMAGTGVLAMPKALEDTGYMGVIIILVLAIASAYVGAILAKCWIIVQDRYDEFKGHVREPYPAIG
ncbi:uncharacterized protein LOC106014209, partial [Aplysia californica]|uniref:Uncharacterized protein LOC106014209 n=1 Tax=Aplysia californica TaxID=6500 RepID=A0ABM1AFX8_APLCA